MTLRKIAHDHYIIVDDLEIKEGDWVYHKASNKVFKYDGRGLCVEVNKITHSRKFLEGVKQLVPSDIPTELIGEVDVEKKAEKFYEFWYDKYGTSEIDTIEKKAVIHGFMGGYNQALEDNKEKKYTDEDMKECVKSILRDLNTHNEIDKPVNFVWTDSFKKHIQSLHPKTEWEVVFVDGKLKLK